MRMAFLVVAMVFLAGCSSDEGTIEPDAGIRIDARPDAPPSAVCDVFGEACKSDPPANTLCHNDKGWCIDDVCRPQCAYDTPRCEGVVFVRSPAGGGYCAPR